MTDVNLLMLPPEEMPQTDPAKKKKKPSNNILGEMLKEIMHEQDPPMSVAELSRKSGVPRSTLHDWISGKVTAQLADINLFLVAKCLNKTLEHLLFGIGDGEVPFERFGDKK